MVTKSSLAQVLEPLYASVLDPARTQDFLDRMTALTGSCLSGILVEDVGHGQGQLSRVSGASEADIAHYRELADDNVWVNASAHALATGGLFDSDDWVSRSELLRSRYYQEFLRGFDDMRHSIALCALRDEDAVVMMTLGRAGALDRFTDAQMAFAREVLPHWVNAYALQRRASWLQQRAVDLDRTLHGLGDATFTLGGDGAVRGMNAAAERLLQAPGPLRLVQGRLGVGHDDGQRFAGALHDAVVGRDEDGAVQRRQRRVPLRDGAGRVVAIAHAHPLPCTLDTPLGTDDVAHGSGRAGRGGAVALLFVVPVQCPSPAALGDALQDLFALTPGEAALAAALHAHGDLALAAQACAIAPASARSRIKLVYDKTGERGQAALVRLLATVARTVPG